jgi:hypothetical protein
MHPRRTARTLVSNLLALVRPASRRRTEPPVGCDEARDRMVAWALRTAALYWENRDTAAAEKNFEMALIDYMAEAAPHVLVTPYEFEEPGDPRSMAYLQLQKVALGLAYVGWGNGRETAYDSMDLDYAYDRFDEALKGYEAAATTA